MVCSDERTDVEIQKRFSQEAIILVVLLTL